jgi:hypothetical protein
MPDFPLGIVVGMMLNLLIFAVIQLVTTWKR